MPCRMLISYASLAEPSCSLNPAHGLSVRVNYLQDKDKSSKYSHFQRGVYQGFSENYFVRLGLRLFQQHNQIRNILAQKSCMPRAQVFEEALASLSLPFPNVASDPSSQAYFAKHTLKKKYPPTSPFPTRSSLRL
ncbi:hypothetical protein L873DRAFT_1790579 [Choiromyces venosus 120613-1]|uniref:Uncharacterized protein n=1 Tax=Choiromyces venosus 120613-1 TaxID=1336337 RepID=A0A3N4JWI0_9PEZI|nr:hypothetical protein L873DRAFT_1790579 [Choiromyces venosus 120613-1]